MSTWLQNGNLKKAKNFKSLIKGDQGQTTVEDRLKKANEQS